MSECKDWNSTVKGQRACVNGQVQKNGTERNNEGKK